MKTTLYLIRHAQAEGNLYRRCQGWYDSLITETGYRQIAALAERFKDVRIDAVYSSDLFRTMTTAGAIYKTHGLELHPLRALREIHMGTWEDKPWAELDRVAPEEMGRFNVMDPNWHAPGGESYPDVARRMTECVKALVRAHPGETVAVVSHGAAIRSMIASLRGLPEDQWRLQGHSDNTAVSMLEAEDGQLRVIFTDDNSHLPKEISTFSKQNWWQAKAGEERPESLYYLPLDMEKEGAKYREIHREAWLSVHGSLDGYQGENFAQAALEQWRRDRRAVTAAYAGQELAGLVQMELDRDGEKGIGYLSFLCMLPEYRRLGLGVQLLGEAISVYRPMGRKFLRLCCSQKNETAQRFYRRYGFYPVGCREGAEGPLDLLEKYIGYDPAPPVEEREEKA